VGTEGQAMRVDRKDLEGLEVHPASAAKMDLRVSLSLAESLKQVHQVHQVFPPPLSQRFLELWRGSPRFTRSFLPHGTGSKKRNRATHEPS
jgi:hypothetical protein